jgi:hypothetical protein
MSQPKGEHLLGNRAMTRMFLTTTDELTRGGENCNVELHNLYSSVDITGWGVNKIMDNEI